MWEVVKVYPIEGRKDFFKYTIQNAGVLAKDFDKKEMYFDSLEQAESVASAKNKVKKRLNMKTNKYNTVTFENLEEFKNRVVLFNETGASNSEVNNAVLTLDNIEDFYTKKNDFFERLKDSKFKEYKEDYKHTLFYKWIQNYLSLNKSIEEVNYIYSKVTLLDLIEVTCIYMEENRNEN